MAEEKKDDLETVRIIVDALESFTDEDRERIMRWSREKLGMSKKQFSSNEITQISESPSVTSQLTTEVGPVDIKSFTKEKDPKSDVQWAATAAYFYRFKAPEFERKETISAKDLQEASHQARGFGFKDALKTLSNGVGRGYFNRAERGTFRLNAVGENLVAMVLPGGSAENGTTRKPSKRKKTKNSKNSKK